MKNYFTACILSILTFLILTNPLSGKNHEIQMETTAKTIMTINPFRIDFDPMERLLLINFEKDPDSLYVGFEPQVFNDTINGTGHLVIGWRVDGKVDVYHQPGLKLDPEKYDIAGKGLANIIEHEMQGVFYELNDRGVQAFYQFTDIIGRQVILRISEKNPRKRKPFGLLAPMGAAAENPSALPLIFLHDFYFVRKKHTEIEISIAGNFHKPDELPIPMDFRKMLFARYSPEPLIATLNPAFEGKLVEIEIIENSSVVTIGSETIELAWSAGSPAIKSITRQNDTYPVKLRFEPAFPDLASLREISAIFGTFMIEAHPSTGQVSGTWSVVRIEGETIIKMTPSGGWKPRPNKLSLRFLYSIAKTFRQWPKSYEWTAKINESENGGLLMNSRWERD